MNEARLLDYIHEGDLVWMQTLHGKNPGYAECIDNNNLEVSDRAVSLFYGCGNYWAAFTHLYGITWRCWSSKPTDVQMFETKWEGF